MQNYQCSPLVSALRQMKLIPAEMFDELDEEDEPLELPVESELMPKVIEWCQQHKGSFMHLCPSSFHALLDSGELVPGEEPVTCELTLPAPSDYEKGFMDTE